MDKLTIVTIFLFALALSSGAEAFVATTPSTKIGTELHSLWRNWIPETVDMLDLAAGRHENENRGFVVVADSPDENDIGTRAELKAVNLLSETTEDAAAAAASEQETLSLFPKKGPGFWATTTAAALLMASCAFVPASLAVSGGGLDFAGLDISNKDFSKGNYKGKDFTQVLARNTNFAGSNLAGCRFPKAYLIDANYEGADIRGVSFEGTNMEGTNLKDAIASGAYFGATIIDSANIENADFTDPQFPPKTLALMCDRPDMKGTNPTTGVDTRDSAMCP
jgi:hypothetical protein